MRIIGVASAFPPNYYSQQALTAALTQYWDGQIPNPSVLRRLHVNACVDGRHLARPFRIITGCHTFGDFNRAWIETAEQLGGSALCKAVAMAGISRGRHRRAVFRFRNRDLKSVHRRTPHQ